MRSSDRDSRARISEMIFKQLADGVQQEFVPLLD